MEEVELEFTRAVKAATKKIEGLETVSEVDRLISIRNVTLEPHDRSVLRGLIQREQNHSKDCCR